MSLYCVQLSAERFLLESEGGLVEQFGLITWKCVEADDKAAAEKQAAALLRTDGELSPLIDPIAPFMIEVIDVTEFHAAEDANNDLERGRIWYLIKPKRWWQFWRKN